MGINAKAFIILNTRHPSDTPAVLNERFRETYSNYWFDGLIDNEEKNLLSTQAKTCSHYSTPCDWYELNLVPRLYDKAYTRGCFHYLGTALEWLRRQPEVEEVYYGGDDCGVSEWTKERADELFEFWFTHGNRPYNRSFK